MSSSGGRNTKLFHLKLSGRRFRNKQRKFVEEEGLEWKKYEGKTSVLSFFF